MRENEKPKATYLSYPHMPSTAASGSSSDRHSALQTLQGPEDSARLSCHPFPELSFHLLLVNRNQLNVTFHNIYVTLSDAKIILNYFYVVPNTEWCDR